MLYFAYGSNMDPAQMKIRCRNSEVVGIAVLPEHELCFPRLSKNRGCGVVSVIPRAGKQAWGVLYQLTPEDADALDANEGFKVGRNTSLNSYNRVEVSVLVGGIPTIVSTYVAVTQETPPLPNLAYLTHLRDGARHHKLPEEYIALLDLLECQ
ncbi:gamma-glutamylcyclotransferase family protein [Mesorhizobium erdmanii]|uniref:gamma-glutamylcyclotransferase family protein n=1 Tax=Mesorhizobium erdmanii TaxID=1777866 RepID=UPI0006846F0D|nr:gamma-glutamylcyclotransferase family protein [Mesorhizobium erdmanii]